MSIDTISCMEENDIIQRQDQGLILFYKIINGFTFVNMKGILSSADTRSNHKFKFKCLQSNCKAFRPFS